MLVRPIHLVKGSHGTMHAQDTHFYVSLHLAQESEVYSYIKACVSYPYSLAVVKNLADVFYLCVLMMAYGPAFTRATIHGIIINTVQSVGSLPEVLASGKLFTVRCI